jgi:hypothetical protein
MADPPARRACGACGEELTDSFVGAGGKAYHSACFACKSCSKDLSGETFIPWEGALYCEQCFKDNIAEKCPECSQGILGPHIQALGASWHDTCFVCHECKTPITDSKFFKHKDDDGMTRPYCREDYMRLHGKVCAECGELIAGKMCSSGGRWWHSKCFKCAECGVALTSTEGKVEFYEREGKIYCEAHSSDTVCIRCGGRVFGEYIRVRGWMGGNRLLVRREWCRRQEREQLKTLQFSLSLSLSVSVCVGL